MPRIEPIAAQDEATQAALRELNNENEAETSFLTSQQWPRLIDAAFTATCVQGPSALLITLDQDADYDSTNFNWFRERFPRFVYIDRIVVSEHHRGTGLARSMYNDLFLGMRAAGQTIVGCEVNMIPPNPGSDAFHARLGFTEVGRAELADREKTVRYFIKHLER